MPRYVVTYEVVGTMNVSALSANGAMEHTLRLKSNSRVLSVEDYDVYHDKLDKLTARRKAIEDAIDDPNVFALQKIMEQFRAEDNRADGVSVAATG